MKLEQKDTVLEECRADISSAYDEILSAESVSADGFNEENTVMCIVDVINGFVKFGALADAGITPIVHSINSLAKKLSEKNVLIAAFNDSHTSDSVEFESFPPHCLSCSEESKLVDELSWLFGYDRFYCKPKSSTNAFLDDDIGKYIKNNKKITNYIVTGDCTDICILQFALSLKAYSSACGRSYNVIVPVNCVDTFCAPSHSRSLMNIAALKLMKNSGIKIVSEIIV